MAEITKAVDRNIPSGDRTQVFTEADAAVGDLILVTESLGRPASSLTISAAADMSVRLNAKQKLFKRQDRPNVSYSGALPELSTEMTYLDRTQAPIAIAGGASLMVDSTPVRDIEIVSALGAFTIMVD